MIRVTLGYVWCLEALLHSTKPLQGSPSSMREVLEPSMEKVHPREVNVEMIGFSCNSVAYLFFGLRGIDSSTTNFLVWFFENSLVKQAWSWNSISRHSNTLLRIGQRSTI